MEDVNRRFGWLAQYHKHEDGKLYLMTVGYDDISERSKVHLAVITPAPSSLDSVQWDHNRQSQTQFHFQVIPCDCCDGHRYYKSGSVSLAANSVAQDDLRGIVSKDRPFITDVFTLMRQVVA